MYTNQEYGHPKNNIVNIMAAMLIGGLAGAVTMLLLAPQSGRATRRQIRKKGMELRDRTNQLVEDAVDQVNSNANKFTKGGRKKIKELKKQGKELAVEQLDRVSEVVEAGKTVIKNS